MSDINMKRLATALHDGRIKTDGVLLTSPVNRRFAIDFASSAGMVLVTPEHSAFITDFRYIEAARASACAERIIMIERGKKYADIVNELCDEFSIDSLSYEDDTMTVREHTQIARQLHTSLVPAGSIYTQLRACKQDFELDHMRAAQKIADKAFDAVLGQIHAGMTEKQLEAKLIYEMYSAGADGLSFDPIVVSGPNSSLPHGRAGQRVISDGDFVTMDFGVLHNGYCSDMTRTVAIGHVTDEMRKIYEIVTEAQNIGLQQARAGVSWLEVDGAARKYITDCGYGDCFGHGLGHGLGLEIHESLMYDPEHPTLTPVNGVVSVEPGIYLPGKFGVRIEDCVILRKDGNENLMSAPKQLIIL